MKYKAIRVKVNYLMFQFAAKFSFIFGLAPCKVNLDACSSNRNTSTVKLSFSVLRCAWNILLNIMFFTLAMTIGPYMRELPYPNNSKTLMKIIITLTVIGNLTAALIISLYSLRQNRVIAIGNQLNYFDETFGTKLFTTSDDAIEDFRNIVTIVVLLVIWCFIYSTTLVSSEKLYLISIGLCLSVCSWLLIQYSLIVNILRERFKGINQAFPTVIQFPIVLEDIATVAENTSNNRLDIEDFSIIRQARNMIFDILCQVTKFYSFPILLVLFFNCSFFINTIYFLILSLLSGGFDYTLINAIFWSLLCLYPVVILSTSVDSIQSEMDRTAKILYEVMKSCIPNEKLESQLNAFAVELLHKKVPFSACGLFALDCTLLHSIFGAVVTYLLILLQFKTTDSL